MSPPEGLGGGDMLPFTECHFLQSPRMAGKEAPFLPESPVPPLPALPWASLRHSQAHPFASFSLAQGAPKMAYPVHREDPFSFSL